jgi:LPXTG-motif cell wall-anchored protein
VRFDVVNVYNIRLASTGTDPIPLGLLGLLVAFLGVALYAAGRVRKPRG